MKGGAVPEKQQAGKKTGAMQLFDFHHWITRAVRGAEEAPKTK